MDTLLSLNSENITLRLLSSAYSNVCNSSKFLFPIYLFFTSSLFSNAWLLLVVCLYLRGRASKPRTDWKLCVEEAREAHWVGTWSFGKNLMMGLDFRFFILSLFCFFREKSSKFLSGCKKRVVHVCETQLSQYWNWATQRNWESSSVCILTFLNLTHLVSVWQLSQSLLVLLFPSLGPIWLNFPM